jgi:hypothetical protein
VCFLQTATEAIPGDCKLHSSFTLSANINRAKQVLSQTAQSQLLKNQKVEEQKIKHYEKK